MARDFTVPHVRRYTAVLVAGLTLWTILVCGLSYLLYQRSDWLRASDEANLREWIDESRVFRKAMPDLLTELMAMRDAGWPDDDGMVIRKRQEIAEQLRRLADPTRMYQGQLPLFPDIFRLEVRFPTSDLKPIFWESPLPRPQHKPGGVSELRYLILGEREPRVVMICEYRLHAYGVRQREAEWGQRQLALAVGLAVAAAAPAAGWFYFALQRERRREMQRVETELAREESERAALELKSQLYAGVGIMAGSYAHNIKNLLVRPNDLLARCIDAEGVTPRQKAMLSEVRETLGTVTGRLQQILQTVRRDPSQAEVAAVNVNILLSELIRTWSDLARERWKVQLEFHGENGLMVLADESQFQQAFENLVFNARDATFEKRNALRAEAHQKGLTEVQQREKLILAAGWKGSIVVRAQRDGEFALVTVVDNGIGMTDDVRRRCTETHFSTKRNNALYEGYSAGMGLGLSFVALIFANHRAEMMIDSFPGGGSTFKVRIPLMKASDARIGN